MDEMLNGAEHTNFFENRATEYSKASTQGYLGRCVRHHSFYLRPLSFIHAPIMPKDDE
jgi:hypothetical protein